MRGVVYLRDRPDDELDSIELLCKQGGAYACFQGDGIKGRGIYFWFGNPERESAWFYNLYFSKTATDLSQKLKVMNKIKSELE